MGQRTLVGGEESDPDRGVVVLRRPAEFAPGTRLLGKLRVIRALGSGAMGAVYEVEHEITHHRRALKVLHPHMTRVSGVVERFLLEASAAGRIGSAHIVETFDAGRLDGGEPFLVMELLQGKTLAQVLDDEYPLPVARVLDILIQACSGIEAAHAAGIVHRDLKPENLFLCGQNLSYVKILDFGVSKFERPIAALGLTGDGAPIGTPNYMSPEQVRGEKALDRRSDVYALGVVLYECLTGELPYTAKSLPELAIKIHDARYRPVRVLRPELPEEFELVVARALARDPVDRYPSAGALAADLRRLSALGCPPGAGDTQPGLTDLPVLAPAAAGARRSSDGLQRKLRLSRRALGIGVAVSCLTGAAVFALRAAERTASEDRAVVPAVRSAPAPRATPAAPEPRSPTPRPENRSSTSAPIAEPTSKAPSATPHSGVRSRRVTSSSASSNSRTATPDTSSRAKAHGLSERNPFE